MVVSCIFDQSLVEIADNWSIEKNSNGKPLYDITILITDEKLQISGIETFHSYLIPFEILVKTDESSEWDKKLN